MKSIILQNYFCEHDKNKIKSKFPFHMAGRK